MNAKPALSSSCRWAFTLVELLVVIAILAGMLLPALSKAKSKGQGVACMNNLGQLQKGWLTYADDNQEAMPLNRISETTGAVGEHWNIPGSWVLGNAGWGNPAYLDLTNITSGTLFAYAPATRLYKCPGDRTLFNLSPTRKGPPVIRSYAIQAALHSKGAYFESSNPPEPYLKFRDCVKLSSVHTPGPSQVWGFIEPNAYGHDIGSFDFVVTRLGSYWAHQPSDRHGMGCNLSFLDGHVKPYRWRTSKEKLQGALPIQPGGDKQDYDRLLSGYPRSR